MMMRMVAAIMLLMSGAVFSHDGDAEDRAMNLLGLQQKMDRTWAALQREADPLKRAALLDAHAQAMRALQDALQHAAEKSPCIMLERNDDVRQQACLIDTEARLRATERALAHVINRLTLGDPSLR